jgi:hypothetical protein
MISKITDIEPGDLIEIMSDAGGCDKAPCVKVVMSVHDGSVTSNEDDDRGYAFNLSMDNYKETVIGKTLTGDDANKKIHIFYK